MTIDWMNPSDDVLEARRIGYDEASADMAQLHDELAAAQAEKVRLQKIISDLVSAGEAMLECQEPNCSLDHHGACQAHHLRQVQQVNGEWEYECEVPLMRRAIEAAGAAKE